MAADRLQVLRKDRQRYDIFIMPKDLKIFNKEKRDLLLANYTDESKDQAYLDSQDVDNTEAAQTVTETSQDGRPSQDARPS